MNSFRRFATLLGLSAMGLMVLATSALAQTTPEAEVGTAVGGASTTATSVISGNIGVVLAVAGAWVALTIGKKLIGKIS